MRIDDESVCVCVGVVLYCITISPGWVCKYVKQHIQHVQRERREKRRGRARETETVRAVGPEAKQKGCAPNLTLPYLGFR